MTDSVIEPCKHTHYNIVFKITMLHNSDLEIKQPYAKFRILCRDCKAPCTFKGDLGFNINAATTSDDETSLFAPIDYPEIKKQEYPVEKEEDDNEEKDIDKKFYH